MTLRATDRRGRNWESSLFLFLIGPIRMDNMNDTDCTSQKVGVNFKMCFFLCSVQFSCSVVSNSLQLHGLQHTSLPCPSPIPGVYSYSCLSRQWCHLTTSSSVIPFSRLQSFPASGSFPMSQFFASGGQSIGVTASASVLPMNIQDWFPWEWSGGTSLQSRGLSRVLATPQFKSINSSGLSFAYGPTLTSIHDYWKNHSFD